MTAVNAVYPSALAAFLSGQIDYTANTVRVLGVRDTYDYDAAHSTLADLPGGSRIASVALTSKAVTAGAATAGPAVLAAGTGDVLSALVIYQDTGTEATSRLIAHLGQRADSTPISVITNASPLAITWPNGIVFTI
jgi:hypothetical protein